jgi:hypothetical protein
MAPKKAKKNKKNDFEDDGEDIKLGDIPIATPCPAAKVPAPAKKKKIKKKPVAGDWSDDENAVTSKPSFPVDDGEEGVAPARESSSKKPATFALLQVPPLSLDF